MNSTSEQHVESFLRRFKLILAVCGPILVVPAIGVILYLDWRFDRFEGGLSYRDPGSSVRSSEVLDAWPWEPVQGQTVYVPVYSHIYHQDGKPLLLTATLSVRNADSAHDIVLTAVRYFDTKGREIKSYLAKPLPLGPMASTEFLVERDDVSGGSGANFIVEWVAGDMTVPPVIESVMIDTAGTQGISFARPGTVIGEIASPSPAER